MRRSTIAYQLGWYAGKVLVTYLSCCFKQLNCNVSLTPSLLLSHDYTGLNTYKEKLHTNLSIRYIYDRRTQLVLWRGALCSFYLISLVICKMYVSKELQNMFIPFITCKLVTGQREISFKIISLSLTQKPGLGRAF